MPTNKKPKVGEIWRLTESQRIAVNSASAEVNRRLQIAFSELAASKGVDSSKYQGKLTNLDDGEIGFSVTEKEGG